MVWGREWDALLHADRDGALVNLMNTTPDGDYQTYKANDGAYVRDHFFGRDPRTKALVEPMTDSEIWNLKRGGHDYRKVYAAYRAATEHKGQPTVILAKTIKGYTLGAALRGPQRHAPDEKACAGRPQARSAMPPAYRSPTRELEKDPYLPPYYHPGPDAPEIRYLLDRRRTLGGFLPERRTKTKALTLPGRDTYKALKKGSGKQRSRHHDGDRAHVQGTVAGQEDRAAHRADHPGRGPHVRHGLVVPEPEDLQPQRPALHRGGRGTDAGVQGKRRSARSCTKGINEAGSTASFTAVGTSYATHNEPMIPIYIFYSMFGFQRTGDGFWAAADQMARGFVLGATAGRTTLTGEGLQHADGHSLLLASTNPAVVAYDPAFAYEIAYIVESGLQRMYGENPENVYFYITDLQRALRAARRAGELRPRGRAARHLPAPATAPEKRTSIAQILASGVAMPEAVRGGRPARREVGRRRRRLVGDQLGRAQPRRRRGREASGCATRDQPAPTAYVTKALADAAGPVVAVSDWMRAVPEQIRPWVPRHVRHAGHRRLRLLRHPPGGAAVLQHRRRVGRRRRAGGTGARRRDRSVGRGRGGQGVQDRRRDGGRRVVRATPAAPEPGPDVRHPLTIADSGIRQKCGVSFGDDRQSVRPPPASTLEVLRDRASSRCCAG